ncbi:recombinase RecT [Paenibacillus daejeonensis]|uniref:recombinase RecT n=1 Tax=Paenibacillus daejeonensis TaxID=135193 RepID=UPI000364D1B5|nr:recombinase RecT [Paenibacillus daejeonensis]
MGEPQDQQQQQEAQPEKALAKKELTQSERFMNMVVKQFSSGVSEVALTQFQKRLAQNYFISLDAALKIGEERRLAKTEKYRDATPMTWQNINMEKLARDVVTYARVGFDPAQKNHINMVPFKNNKTGQYDIGFVEGYRGMELKAVKYGLDVPDKVIVELVYSTDKFFPIKRDARNDVEAYEFDITNPFKRGEIIGGFYYHSFSQAPHKNKLVMLSIEEILKRRPKSAAPEFWGGEKDVWTKDEKTGRNKKTGKEKVEGWYDQMCLKTVIRAAYNDITIDSQKIDDDYLRLSQLEQEYAVQSVEDEIGEHGNRQRIDVTPEGQDDDPEPASDPEQPPASNEGSDQKKPAADTMPPNPDEMDLDFE